MSSQRLLPSLIIFLLMTTACTQTALPTGTPAAPISPQANAVAPADTQSQTMGTVIPTETKNPATETVPPAETQSQPTETDIPSTLPVKLDPQTQSNCSDKASFVADVTIPDNTLFGPGKAFVKTWRIRNTGTCSWSESYSMAFVNGDQMNSPVSIPFKATSPGATLDISANLIAPAVAGAYTGNYELHNASGELFLIDNTRLVWVKINVSGGNDGQSTTAPVADTAAATPVSGTSGACSYFEDSAVENDLVTQINAIRADYGLPSLTRNAKLSAAALSHSIDMACHSSIDHNGSDGSTITGRMTAYGYHYSYWNEAIYAQPPQYGGNAQAAVDWWFNDPPHRVIILSPDARDIGPGYAYVAGSKLGGYFTIDVASPAP
jgi:uncharacterized protein YkwD